MKIKVKRKTDFQEFSVHYFDVNACYHCLICINGRKLMFCLLK